MNKLRLYSLIGSATSFLLITFTFSIAEAGLDYIVLSPATASIAVGSTQKFTATAYYSRGVAEDVTDMAFWTSSDTTAATIDKTTGLATAKKAGNTTIKATTGGKFGTATLTVTGATISKIEVTPAGPTLFVGETQSFKATGSFSDGTVADMTSLVKWTSSDSLIATIHPTGLATALKAGAVTITATKDVTGTATLTVTDKPAATLTSITVKPPTATLAIGGTLALIATGKFSDDSTKDITTSVIWSSDTPAVATVVFDKGGVKAVKVGTATITATKDGKSGKADLSVTSMGAVQIAAGPSQTCALKTDGTATCWGYSSTTTSLLDDGGIADSSYPAFVKDPLDASKNLSDITKIAAGLYHTCVRRKEGSGFAIYCWGGNHSGQLGQEVAGPYWWPMSTRKKPTEDPGFFSYSWPVPSPTKITGLSGSVAEVAPGYGYTCARKTDGTVSCWGLNDYGQLGDGTMVNRLIPTPVKGLSDITQIAARLWHSCALKNDGTVYCWGSNMFGQVGDGTYPKFTKVGGFIFDVGIENPKLVSGLLNITQIAAGPSHTCAVKNDGIVYCWGFNHGRTPSLVAGISGATSVACGGAGTTCILKTDGAVYCLGYNQYGELGNGKKSITTPPKFDWTPTKVVGLSDVVEIAAGWGHACARKSDGKIYCWGRNDYGQLGDGSTSDRLEPIEVKLP